MPPRANFEIRAAAAPLADRRATALSPAGANDVPGGDREAAAWLRTEMGDELLRRRTAAGLSQARFAGLARYSQAAVAHAEKGRDDVGAAFWAAADRVLAADGLFAGLFAELRECLEPTRRAAVRTGAADQALRCADVLRSAEPGRALAGYRRLGWPAAARGAELVLATGQVVDALEVGRAAGMVAAGAWLESGATPGSTTPGASALPPPDGALAVIEAGERWFFLARAGFPVPWPAPDDPRSRKDHQTKDDPPEDRAGEDRAGERGPEIRWHSAGGRIALPPSPAPSPACGPAIRWAYLPTALLRPAPPLALLDLLGWAVTATRAPGRLLLPNGATVIIADPPPRHLSPVQQPAQTPARLPAAHGHPSLRAAAHDHLSLYASGP